MFGTGDGFSADEIVTGYMSAERLVAGSITTNQISPSVGEELDISSNKSIQLVVSNLRTDLTNYIEESVAKIEIDEDKIVAAVEKTDRFVTKEDAENFSTKDEVEELVGYRMEIISTSDVLSSEITETTLMARVWHGSMDVTDTLDASRFNWKRYSSDSMGDEIWNTNHRGMKQITLTTLDVLYSATYDCELTSEE